MMNGVEALSSLDIFRTSGSGLAGATGPAEAGASGPASFAEALKDVAGETVAKLGSAESLSLQALQGDVPTREVVDAVMSAEQALQTAIAIRDKIVTAYLEISRMAI
jgi:flagellar hook-basal body complex protein FliE